MADDFGEYFELSGSASSEDELPSVLAERYVVSALLGAGAFGRVYDALDQVTGKRAALKLFPADGNPRRIRREVLALRGLQLPGVVHLSDEGESNGRRFLVMERIEGRSFPGDIRPPVCWTALQPIAIALLRVLADVHAAGVLHLDLKPSNILVRRDGSVVLVDFGLSLGPGVGAPATRCERQAGTRRYLAPEQQRGDALTAAADLYAVGRLLVEQLGADLSRPDLQAFKTVFAAAEVPPEAQATLLRLLELEPAQRPGSAEEVLAGLGVSEGTHPALSPARSEEDWRPLFNQPERLLHAPSDGARALFDASDGDPDRALHTLQSWQRRGWARLEDAGIWLSAAGRSALSFQTEREAGEAALRQAATGEIFESAKRLSELGTQLERQGRTAEASLWLDQGLWLLHTTRWQRNADPSVFSTLELALADNLVRVALESENPRVLERALVAVSRPDSQALKHSCALLSAALLIHKGEATRALSAALGVGVLRNPELELCRRRVLLQATGRLHPSMQAQELESVLEWVERIGHAPGRARVLGWMGLLRYNQGHFEQAAQLQEDAANLAQEGIRHLSALSNAASACLETGRYEKTREFAQECLTNARRTRHLYFEARAEWLLRASAYRAGEAKAPDLELVYASTHLGMPSLEGLIVLNEAAVCWRLGLQEDARRLAQRAEELFRAEAWEPGRQLARALWLAAGPGSPTPDSEALSAEISQRAIPDVDWQALGVLAISGCVEAKWVAEARRRAMQAPDPVRRRELLSPNEALGGDQG